VTATDLVLTVTEMLRNAKVVGKFVEFFGTGAATLAVPDRATIANMAPEVRRDHGLLPGGRQDHRLLPLDRPQRRDRRRRPRAYFKAQGLFGMPNAGDIDYFAGTRARPRHGARLGRGTQASRRIASSWARSRASSPPSSRSRDQNGFAKKASDLPTRCHDEGRHRDRLRRRPHRGDHLVHQHLEPERADRGGTPREEGRGEGPHRQAAHQDLARARGRASVTEYLTAGGLLPYLEKLNFYVSGYGCTTCIGNAGPLAEPIEQAVVDNDLVCAAVLSGNRNFEARIHPNIRANFLASPPLVVAYAIAGSVLKDLEKEPLGEGKDGPGLPQGHLAHEP
jgi:aconitate hydratase